jgi:hypothetical protein
MAYSSENPRHQHETAQTAQTAYVWDDERCVLRRVHRSRWLPKNLQDSWTTKRLHIQRTVKAVTSKSKFAQSVYKRLLRYRFVKDMRIVSRLRHPCILQIMGAVMNSREFDPLIVTEIMEVGSLYSLLHNETVVLEGDLLLPVLKDIGHGMSYLHCGSRPVVHGNLSSANVVLNASFRAKVVHLGTFLSRCSPCFMAPELLLGSKPSTRSDVFAFGVTLYECLTRREPYWREIQNGQIEDVVRDVADFDTLTRLEPAEECPPKLADLMYKCLEKIQGKRPDFSWITMCLESITEYPYAIAIDGYQTLSGLCNGNNAHTSSMKRAESESNDEATGRGGSASRVRYGSKRLGSNSRDDSESEDDQDGLKENHVLSTVSYGSKRLSSNSRDEFESESHDGDGQRTVTSRVKASASRENVRTDDDGSTRAHRKDAVHTMKSKNVGTKRGGSTHSFVSVDSKSSHETSTGTCTGTDQFHHHDDVERADSINHQGDIERAEITTSYKKQEECENNDDDNCGLVGENGPDLSRRKYDAITIKADSVIARGTLIEPAKCHVVLSRYEDHIVKATDAIGEIIPHSNERDGLARNRGQIFAQNDGQCMPKNGQVEQHGGEGVKRGSKIISRENGQSKGHADKHKSRADKDMSHAETHGGRAHDTHHGIEKDSDSNTAFLWEDCRVRAAENPAEARMTNTVSLYRSTSWEEFPVRTAEVVAQARHRDVASVLAITVLEPPDARSYYISMHRSHTDTAEEARRTFSRDQSTFSVSSRDYVRDMVSRDRQHDYAQRVQRLVDALHEKWEMLAREFQVTSLGTITDNYMVFYACLYVYVYVMCMCAYVCVCVCIRSGKCLRGSFKSRLWAP